MKKTKKIIFTRFVVSIMSVILTLFLLSSVNAYAGCSQSSKNDGTHGTGGNNGNKWGMGQDYGHGLAWRPIPSNGRVHSDLGGLAKLGVSSDLEIENLTLGMYVGINSTIGTDSKNEEKNFTWLRWPWWFRVYSYNGGICYPADFVKKEWYTKYGNKFVAWDPDNLYGQLRSKGALPNSVLIKEAERNGYKYDSSKQIYYNSSKNDYLDAVWIAESVEKKTEIKDILISVVSKDKKTGKTEVLYEDPNENKLLKMFEEGKEQYNYLLSSLPNELNHQRTLTSKFVTIRREQEITKKEGKIVSTISRYYRVGSTKILTRDFEYNAKTPDITTKQFMPFDLNRNGVALYEDVKKDYPDFKPVGNLNITVDNMQNIKDGSHIKALDINTGIPFEVKINNNQFGIPTKDQGGFELKESVNFDEFKTEVGNVYKADVFNKFGIIKDLNLGEFKSNSLYLNIKGATTNPIYWGGAINASLNSKSVSITYNGQEKIGDKEGFILGKNWTGGTFNFKAISTGIYNLSSKNSKNWWVINYNAGQFFNYGVKYGGIINSSGIKDPSIKSNNFYIGLNTKLTYQPLLKASFEVKTLGGN